MTRTIRQIILACLVTVGFMSSASATPAVLDGEPAVRHKTMLFEGRHLITPYIGTTVNDPYRHQILAGLGWRYYLSEWGGIGLDVMGGGGINTALTDQIQRELSTAGQPFELDVSTLQLLAHVVGEFVPFNGKFLLFGSMARIDVHLTVGVGMAMASGSGRIDDEISFAPLAGAGLRFFPTDWVSVGFDFRWIYAQRTLAARRDGSVPGSVYDSNWFVGATLGFMFPTLPETGP